MTSRAISLVEAGLDYFFQYQKNQGRKQRRTFTRTMLAHCIRQATSTPCDEDFVSTLLQEYRTLQKAGSRTKYHIAARSYGRNARWYVMTGPGLQSLTGEGMTMAHAEWVISDAAARCTKDFIHELLPPANAHTAIQPRIEATRKKIIAALNGLLNDVRLDKETWEQANKRTAEILAKLTPADALLAEELDGPAA